MKTVDFKIKIRPKTGYKFFKIIKNPCNKDCSLLGMFYGTDYKPGIWYSCDNPETKIYYGRHYGRYPAGFHIFTNKNQAKRTGLSGDGAKLYRVQYLNIVASGLDCGAKCVVAQFMKIIDEVK